MSVVARDKIFPHLWYAKEAEEAARFYATLFPDSSLDRVTTLPSENSGRPVGSAKIVDFTLFGKRFQAISAGPLEPFNHAISLVVMCEDQAELDRYWEALLDGGKAEQCGWLRDRYGVCWQIVPRALETMMTQGDPVAAQRMTQAMLKMVKLDIEALTAAYQGR